MGSGASGFAYNSSGGRVDALLNHTHSVSSGGNQATIDNSGNHDNHYYYNWTNQISGGGDASNRRAPVSVAQIKTQGPPDGTPPGKHGHLFSFNVTSGQQGNGANSLPPYYVLYYIMRIED